jgi:hypothetical protein
MATKGWLSLCGPDLGDIDVEEADRVGLKYLRAGLSPSVSGGQAMPWRFGQWCSAEGVKCGLQAAGG